jgi:hypothetical protein
MRNTDHQIHSDNPEVHASCESGGHLIQLQGTPKGHAFGGKQLILRFQGELEVSPEQRKREHSPGQVEAEVEAQVCEGARLSDSWLQGRL